ncbi:MAG: hypothetical protein HY695_29690 [Deltaproteobacteria bacterium]|nr:hypothetical protein [Deltaproteobacteria bacterium]
MTIKKSGWKLLPCLGLVLPLLLVSQEVQAQADFFKGKTLTLVYGSTPGGIGDMRVRALVPFIRKHMPGEPGIVLEFMPGGAGRKAANYIYGVARPDGLTLGGAPGSFIASAILAEPGVNYDLAKLVYLGSSESATHYTFLSRKEAGLETLEKLRAATGVRIGAQAVGHAVYVTGRLFAYFLGLKEPKFVTGYSSAELDLALVRGEIDARAETTSSIVNRNPDWIDKGMMHFHAVLEIPKGAHHPRFARLPELEDFVSSQKERELLALFRAFRHVGITPYFLPPGVSRDRAAILQEAFRKALRDPRFHREYKKLTGDEPTPILPDEQEKIMRGISRAPEIIALFKKFPGPDPLPRR